MIAIVDLDGVLADATHREFHLSSRPPDWDAFFARVGDDPAIAYGIALVRDLAREHEVIVLSGRPERTRAATTAWLREHGIEPTRIVLRRDTDRRPAAQYKAAALARLGAPDQIAVVVDDDPSVIDELGRRGYATLLFDPDGAQ